MTVRAKCPHCAWSIDYDGRSGLAGAIEALQKAEAHEATHEPRQPVENPITNVEAELYNLHGLRMEHQAIMVSVTRQQQNDEAARAQHASKVLRRFRLRRTQ